MATGTGGTLAGLGVVLAAPGSEEVPADVLAASAAVAEVAVRSGCASLWVGEPAADPPARVPYEAFSLLGALSRLTTGIHLGVAAVAAQRRAPSVLAKIVTGIDVLSGGRAVLTLDGDAGRDGDAPRLAEALAVARAVLEDDLPTVDGRIYHVAGAVNRPAPVQAGGVPLVVFVEGTGPGRAGLLEVCARSADAVVVDGGADGVRDTLALVSGAAGDRTRPGRRPSVLARVSVAAAAGAVREAGADGCLLEVPAPWEPGALAGADLVW